MVKNDGAKAGDSPQPAGDFLLRRSFHDENDTLTPQPGQFPLSFFQYLM
jgi:hypothetical protein